MEKMGPSIVFYALLTDVACSVSVHRHAFIKVAVSRITHLEKLSQEMFSFLKIYIYSPSQSFLLAAILVNLLYRGLKIFSVHLKNDGKEWVCDEDEERHCRCTLVYLRTQFITPGRKLMGLLNQEDSR